MRKHWKQNEIDYMRKFYPLLPTSTIAFVLNRSLSSVYGQANIMGLNKCEDFNKTEHSGRITKGKVIGYDTQFKTGQTPKNKGKKWSGFMSEQAQQNSLKTAFKKGNLPKNTLYNGAITVRKDKRGVPYKFIRIAKGVWEPLHVHNWKQTNGPIPKGYVIIFNTPGTDNCNVENLSCISQADNMRRNTIHRYPEEVKQTIRTLTKLKKTIHGKEQNSRPTQPSI